MRVKSQSKAAKAGRKRTAARRRTQRELMAEARKIVFERDGHQCLHTGYNAVTQAVVRCGLTGQLQLAHVFSRRFVAIRHDHDNLMTLCAWHHRWWHDYPVDAGLWFANEYPERYAALKLKLKQGLKPVEGRSGTD